MALSRFNTSEYLLRYPSGLFIFRVKVPRDCRPVIPQAELRYSLKTRCFYKARKHLATVLPFVQRLFDDVRHASLATSVVIPGPSIRLSSQGVIQRALLDDSAARISVLPWETPSTTQNDQGPHLANQAKENTATAADEYTGQLQPREGNEENPGNSLETERPRHTTKDQGNPGNSASPVELVETRRQSLSSPVYIISRRSTVTSQSETKSSPTRLSKKAVHR